MSKCAFVSSAWSRRNWIVLATLILGLPGLRADQSILVRSGNGVVGSQDTQVHSVRYAVGQDTPPTASDFAAVQAGTDAYIDTPYPTYLTPANFSDPLAQWIGTTSALGAGSALYGIPFKVTDPIIAAATLSLGYSVDNLVHGVFINGTEISNFVSDGDYHGEYYYMRSDIASLLIPNATNWLYIKTYDSGGFAGLMFSATITTQGTSPGAPTITPNEGGNAGSVSFRIIGSGFEAGTSPGATPAHANPTVTLTGTGATITATNVNVVSPNILTGTFPLTGASAGVDTVTVTNWGGTSVALTNAFTVSAGGAAQLSIQKIGNEAVAGYNESFFITVTNTGAVDSGATSVDEVLQPGFTFSLAQPTPTTTATSPDITSPDANATYTSWLEWNLPNVPAGSTANLTYTAKLNSTFPANSPVVGPSCLQAAQGDCFDVWSTCVNQVVTSIGGIPTDCPKGLGLFVPPVGPICAGAVWGCTIGYAACELTAKYTCASATYDAKAAKDPNYVSGPSGYGSLGWFKPNPPFQYSLSYENEASATKAATNVYLSDTFDPTKFDLSTLVLNGFVIAGIMHSLASIPLVNQPVVADIDLRPTQQLIVRVNASLDSSDGNVTVSLQSLDPSTGLAPTDPTVGFLAPGADGSVLLTAQPISASTTGTAFQDGGSVIFDFNAAINTNIWINTVDVTPPTSKVVALSAVTANPSLNVAWSGTDVGSGIQYYSIYVSDSGAAYTAWQTNVTTTSATYTGTVGHTYGFYSIATDNVNNLESAKTSADTTVQVVPMIGTTTTVSASANPANVGASVTFTASVAPAGGTGIPTGTVTFNDGSTPLGTGTLNASAQATYSTSALAAGSHSITAVYGGDSTYTGSTSAVLSQVVNAPAFTISVSPNTVTVTQGQSGQTTVTITPVGGFSSAISLSCSGVPTNSTCTLSPSSVTPTGNNAAITSTVSIATNVKTTAATDDNLLRRRGIALALVLFGAPMLWFLGARKARRNWFLLMVLTAASVGIAAALAGCGSSGPTTPKGSSTVTITAAAGSSTQTATVSLTVQ